MEKENQVIRLLKAEEEKLEKIIREAELVLEKTPAGSVEIKKHKKDVQYYRRLSPQEKHGAYMPVSEHGTALALIRKRYLEQIVRAAKEQLCVIRPFLFKYHPDRLKDVFASLSPQRQKAVVPVELPDDLYIREWLDTEYTPKGFKEGIPEHYSRNGERVRSKSEVLIADALFAAGIPYHYERPMSVSGKIIHPDFTILRIGDRKEIYWEHFGLIDDSGYRNDAIIRVREYEDCGVFPGDSLIITMESNKCPINRKVINRMIEHYLMV